MNTSTHIIEFNFFCISYAHDSWVEKFDRFDILKKMKNTSSCRTNISNYLLNRVGLNNRYVFDMDDEMIKLSAMSCEQMMTCIKLCGATVFSRIIKDIINGDDIKVLKEFLGEEGYMFILKSAPFIKHNMHSKNPARVADVNALCDQILDMGLQIFKRTHAKADKSIYKRLLLKLPYEIYQKLLRKNNVLLGDPDKLFFHIADEVSM